MERTLRRYEEDLLRRVAGRLARPRSHWPADDLIARCVATANDDTVVERRLRELEPAERQLLALVGHSRQPRWSLGNLVEMMLALGQDDGLRPVFALLEAGLLFPVLPDLHNDSPRLPKLRSFEHWVTSAGTAGLEVFAHPLAAARAVGEELPFDETPEAVRVSGPPTEADGLDWPLRLAVLRQRVEASPLRRTQQGDFFKRDVDRLDNDPLLNGPSGEGLPAVPEAGFLAVVLASLTGLIEDREGELHAAAFPPAWDGSLPGLLAALWAALPRMQDWDPLDGWRHGAAGNPFPSAGLLALLYLGRLPGERWTLPETVQEWVSASHPYWSQEDDARPSKRRDWASPLLLGLAFQLRMVEVARAPDGAWAVRLSPLGRWLLGLSADAPDVPAFPRTLLVQPNLEIVAYRQGLTPPLIALLGRVASWQTLGSVCTLQLGPDSVYRALEGGLTYEGILQAFEQHGTRATPPAVVESLRTWANKRDRITVYPSGALLEFGSKEDLDAALARGFPGVRLSERLAVAASEANIDYRHFRLTSSRDYAARPEQCVEVGEDGVTLTVDLTRSDLLLESELSRFAEPVDKPGNNVRRRYRLTPESLAAARRAGLTPQGLTSWFEQRTGVSASPAALLLLNGAQEPPPRMRTLLVLNVASEEAADGLMQWPATRELIAERLGPTALCVAEDKLDALREQLKALGIGVEG
jgi:hypothetical protein